MSRPAEKQGARVTVTALLDSGANVVNFKEPVLADIGALGPKEEVSITGWHKSMSVKRPVCTVSFSAEFCGVAEGQSASQRTDFTRRIDTESRHNIIPPSYLYDNFGGMTRLEPYMDVTFAGSGVQVPVVRINDQYWVKFTVLQQKNIANISAAAELDGSEMMAASANAPYGKHVTGAEQAHLWGARSIQRGWRIRSPAPRECNHGDGSREAKHQANATHS